MPSPLLDLDGAVAGAGIDADVAAHYGSFNGEQRRLSAGEGFVDLSHRDVLQVAGPDRLTWLHNLTTQWFTGLEPGQWVQALVLSPNGHVEHAFAGSDDGETFTAHTEPGAGAALREFLDSMRFMLRVEVTDATSELAVVWRPPAAKAQGYSFIDRDRLLEFPAAAGPAAGMWAFEALRIARGEPRLHLDTDHKTLPNEVGWLATDTESKAVHLNKGCYRGQETVARVHNLGRPPRRLTLLHLDGTANALPLQGSPLLLEDREVGFVGTSARHHELGPIALGLIKRNVALDAVLRAGAGDEGIPASQEVIVDPEVGLHVRPRL